MLRWKSCPRYVDLLDPGVQPIDDRGLTVGDQPDALRPDHGDDAITN